MAEVPEHLLQRSAARRAALQGGAAPEASSSAPATTGDAAPAAASAAPAAPAKVTPTEPAFKEPVDRVAAQRVDALRRRRIPAWAMGVLMILPLWGFLYIGAFGTRATHEEGPVDGAAIYGGNCASCHGANGEGGAGPRLAGGEAVKTFPDEADHLSWIETGSAPFKGKGYGDPAREGGQHVATGNMPAFQGKLSPEEIEAVATYEREGL